MPTLTLKGNFKRGWPNPHIVEKVAQANASCVLSSNTPLYGFMGGHLDPATGTWVLGVDTLAHTCYIFRNGVDEADAGRSATIPNDYIQASYGGIQGVSFTNPLLVSTIQYAGTPAVGQAMYCANTGIFTPAAVGSGNIVVAIVDEAPFAYQGVSYITLQPVAPYAA